MSAIPVADISAFANSRDPEARRAAATPIAAAIRKHGCAAITGHGLSNEKLRDAFTMIRKLFDLSISEKKKAPHPDALEPHRGYLAKSIENSGKFGVLFSKSDEEKAFLQNALDWKETYDIGHEDNDDQKNIWLPEEAFPGFRPYMVELYGRLSEIALVILEILMAGMDLSDKDCDTLRQVHTPVEHQMRLAHYLPFALENQKETNKIRLAPHRDFASFTLLFQEGQPGLEFQNLETGEYMPATPKEGALYLNIADLFARYSNGYYPSAMHRVEIPATKNPDGTIPGRYSIPYFVHVGRQETISPMPSRVEADGKANFEPATYRELVAGLMGVMPEAKH